MRYLRSSRNGLHIKLKNQTQNRLPLWLFLLILVMGFFGQVTDFFQGEVRLGQVFQGFLKETSFVDVSFDISLWASLDKLRIFSKIRLGQVFQGFFQNTFHFDIDLFQKALDCASYIIVTKIQVRIPRSPEFISKFCSYEIFMAVKVFIYVF